MISLKWFRENFEELEKRYEGRCLEEGILLKIKLLDSEIISLKQEIDNLRAEKNKLSQSYKDNQSISLSGEIKTKLSELEKKLTQKEEEFNSLFFSLPAIPDESIPLENKVVKVWGELPQNKKIQSYLELATNLNMLDLELASNITGSGYSAYTGQGEKLMRILIEFTLDWAEQFGFQRYYLPLVINKDSLFCTAQLNKFDKNLFQLNLSDKFLSPTAEVQLVNTCRNKILSEDELPIQICANTNCFRNEKIGSGVENKGIMRLFQFNKTEIVMFVEPEQSEQAQEFMSFAIESLLEKLELPYRKVLLSREELSFSSSKTYDFEVWIPSENQYREISSLSNTRDFQALRGKIRYKKVKLDAFEKSKYVHILNGSCLAIDRLFAAVLENWQTEEGEIQIPSSLVTTFGFEKISREKEIIDDKFKH